MVYKVNISECPECFDNCHKKVLEFFGSTDEILRLSDYKNISHFTLMQEAWKFLFNITPIQNRGNAFFDVLEFKDEKQYMLWKIKWS